MKGSIDNSCNGVGNIGFDLTEKAGRHENEIEKKSFWGSKISRNFCYMKHLCDVMKIKVVFFRF